MIYCCSFVSSQRLFEERKKMRTGIVVVLLLITSVPCWADELPTCQPKDFHYEFTECDDQGGRWRVSVPRPDACVGGAPNPPQRVNDCTTSCGAGMYLDRTQLQCVTCPMGKYSLGGGLRFNQWGGELPSGFRITSEAIESGFRAKRPSASSPASLMESTTNCSKWGWQAMSSYVASRGGPCVSVLTYSSKLVKPGVLTYTYQYTDDTVIFNFEAQNDQCQSIENSEKYKWPPTTDEEKWKTMNVNLQAGLNVLYWKTVGMDTGEGKMNKPVKIKSIELSGVAYTSECTPCEPGTYSDSAGSVECKPCPANTYSIGDANSCTPCQDNLYALPGSGKCVKRPACVANDYYEVRSACDRTNMTTIHYEWVTPQICNPALPDSVQLPVSGKVVPCPSCNPGMHHSSKLMCDYCPPGNYSDGFKECQDCPASTVPNYGYFLKTWHELPSNVGVRCMSLQGFGCRNATAWKPSGDFIQSGQGHGDDAYLILSLDVGRFRSKDVVFGGRTMAYGTVGFTFELDCTGACELVFMAANSRSGVSVIKSWTGRQEKQHFSHYVIQNGSYTFSWAFQRSSANEGQKPSRASRRMTAEDTAFIYDIRVTNTVAGGAEKCTPCPEGSEAKGCIPCGLGQYIQDKENVVCQQCPPNTYVTERLPYGVESCKPCGPGLRSEDGQSCYSDCKVFLQQDQEFDFRPLPSFLEVRGRKLFTASGTQYYHAFNISLCGNHGRPVAMCINNVTYHMQDEYLGDIVSSQICRSTIVPSQQSEMSTPLAIQSVSLGDELIGVTTKSTYNDISVIKEFLAGPGQKPDIHFYYYSSSPTQACQKGRATTISLRCDKNAGPNGTVSLPKSCPDGTCDGCTFHFLWSTALACRICTPEDYEVVKGECLSGTQTLHYISPQGCIPRGGAAETMTKSQPCSVIPRQLQIIIGIGVALGVLLFGMLIYFWKKNRKLEYKYMKLVASSSSKDGELPAAESCGIEEDEEDHFENGVFDGQDKKGLLQKFRTVRIGSGKSGEGHPFETIHLTKGEMVS